MKMQNKREKVRLVALAYLLDITESCYTYSGFNVRFMSFYDAVALSDKHFDLFGKIHYLRDSLTTHWLDNK